MKMVFLRHLESAAFFAMADRLLARGVVEADGFSFRALFNPNPDCACRLPLIMRLVYYGTGLHPAKALMAQELWNIYPSTLNFQLR